MIISVFTPHGGCPERCSFCDQAVSGGTPASARMVADAIEAHLGSRERAEEIAFYGGTFTSMPRERQLAYLEAARPYLDDGRIGAVRISTRPDAIDAAWLAELKQRYRLETVELGAQSFAPKALAALGRSHSVESIAEAVATLRSLGLKVGLHLMLGCPEEEEEEEEEPGNTLPHKADSLTASHLECLRPDFVRIHPLLVLKGTALETQWREGRFEPIGLEEAVARAAWLVDRIEAWGGRVIRLGLQPNELLGQAVVGGAYHPSFGDLVQGRRLRNGVESALNGLLEGRNAMHEGEVELTTPERLAGSLKGKDFANLKWLESRFGLPTIMVNVVRETANGKVEVRLRNLDRPAQRGQVEPAQPLRR